MKESISYIVRNADQLAKLLRILGRMRLTNSDGKEIPKLVTIERWNRQRTKAQNNLLWLWLGLIAEHYNHTHGRRTSDEHWHEYFKTALLKMRVMKIKRRKVKLRKSTTDLNVTEFAQYLTEIDQFAIDELDLILPCPSELYDVAMAHKKAPEQSGLKTPLGTVGPQMEDERPGDECTQP